MAMHIEQPASRHSAPASMNTRSRPSASAAFLMRWEPGTMSARTPGATLRPLKMVAAARRSDMREFVQLPMKTTSTFCPAMGAPGASPM